MEPRTRVLNGALAQLAECKFAAEEQREPRTAEELADDVSRKFDFVLRDKSQDGSSVQGALLSWLSTPTECSILVSAICHALHDRLDENACLLGVPGAQKQARLRKVVEFVIDNFSAVFAEPGSRQRYWPLELLHWLVVSRPRPQFAMLSLWFLRMLARRDPTCAFVRARGLASLLIYLASPDTARTHSAGSNLNRLTQRDDDYVVDTEDRVLLPSSKAKIKDTYIAASIRYGAHADAAYDPPVARAAALRCWLGSQAMALVVLCGAHPGAQDQADIGQTLSWGDAGAVDGQVVWSVVHEDVGRQLAAALPAEADLFR